MRGLRLCDAVVTGAEDEVVVLQRRLGDAEASNGQLNEELEKVGLLSELKPPND